MDLIVQVVESVYLVSDNHVQNILPLTCHTP
jgi:hypothetical protein